MDPLGQVAELSPSCQVVRLSGTEKNSEKMDEAKVTKMCSVTMFRQGILGLGKGPPTFGVTK